MKFVLIPPGEFMMGMTREQADALMVGDHGKAMAPSCVPAHRVRLSQAYYLGRHEVTQGQYEAVTGSNPSFFSRSGEGREQVAKVEPSKHPVEQVSFVQAAEFCVKLSEREALRPAYSSADNAITRISGNGYRIPTEAEWEWACRAGTTTPWFHGEQHSNLQVMAWYSVNSGGRTHAVGGLQANAFGLYDMNGNVFEWCQDWHDAEEYKRRGGTTTDPQGAAQGSGRVIKGGHYLTGPADECRSAFHFAFGAADTFLCGGFRVALTTDAVKAAIERRGVDVAKDPKPPGPPRSAPQTVEAILNGDFEQGAERKLPASWSDRSWRQLPDTVILTSESPHGGKQCVLLRASEADDDLMCYQTVPVQPQTEYEITAFVRTMDVAVAGGGGFGAGLSIAGGHECSENLKGTSPWTKVTLRFNSNDRRSIEVGPRLGHHGSTATGIAWFDDIVMRKVSP
jgi:formylglycine-generating enzyme required for sulfatase activity